MDIRVSMAMHHDFPFNFNGFFGMDIIMGFAWNRVSRAGLLCESTLLSLIQTRAYKTTARSE